MNKKWEPQHHKENKYHRNIKPVKYLNKKSAREKKNPVSHHRWLEYKKTRNRRNFQLRKRTKFFQQLAQLSPEKLAEIQETEEILNSLNKSRIKY
jgi:hypothetical protein